jgi:hypothetical protein
VSWYDDPTPHAAAMQAELNRMPDPSRNPCEQVERENDALHERIRTLEDALRTFAEEAVEFNHKLDTDPDLDDEECMVDGDPWPCKYENARRALEVGSEPL